MGTLGLELVQRRKVMGITGEGSSQDAEGYDELQTHFCKLYPNLFTRIGKIRNAKKRAEFFEKLKPVQQKVPQNKVDKEIDRLIKEGHNKKIQDYSDKHFVSPILNAFKVQPNAFKGDILIASKGTRTEHNALVEKISNKLDVSNAALKLRKCELAKTECEWLGFRIGKNGLAPLNRKTQAVEDLKTPKSRKQLKSLMGSMHKLGPA